MMFVDAVWTSKVERPEIWADCNWVIRFLGPEKGWNAGLHVFHPRNVVILSVKTSYGVVSEIVNVCKCILQTYYIHKLNVRDYME